MLSLIIVIFHLKLMLANDSKTILVPLAFEESHRKSMKVAFDSVKEPKWIIASESVNLTYDFTRFDSPNIPLLFSFGALYLANMLNCLPREKNLSSSRNFKISIIS